MWLVVGPLYLFFNITKDYFYFIKILCDYDMDKEINREKEQEDFK
jgi:hypothetical protein